MKMEIVTITFILLLAGMFSLTQNALIIVPSTYNTGKKITPQFERQTRLLTEIECQSEE